MILIETHNCHFHKLSLKVYDKNLKLIKLSLYNTIKTVFQGSMKTKKMKSQNKNEIQVVLTLKTC